jgi:probable HAF family extracellular repeat protein
MSSIGAGTASAVSGNGEVIVGNRLPPAFNTEAFRWQDGTMTGLGDFDGGAFASQALDVNADGSVIVGSGTRPLRL